MLKLHKLTVSIGEKKILDSIDFEFEKGKIYAIMGPNGSGKSTLAATIMGHQAYEVGETSKIEYNGKEIQELESHERSKKGIFMSFQSPLSLTGVNIYQLLRFALDGKMDPLEIRRKVQKLAKKLRIKKDLLTRSLNEDFSGGEKKKMEIIQAAVLDPSLYIFDEIDTGVDIDALKTIADFMNELKGAEKTFIIITHYNRILKYVHPDKVLVLVDGKLAKVGGQSLAEEIETHGYK